MNTTKLKNVCVVVSGTTPKSTDERYWNGTHVWITPAELSEDSFIVTDSERHITDEAIKATGLKSFPKGTVLLSSRAPIGKVAIAGCEMYCNQGFKNLICSESIYNLYLYYFLKSKTAYLNSLGRGATFKEISKGIVEDISIPFPVYSEQIRIAKQLQKIRELISLKKGQYRYFDDIIRSRFIEMFGDSQSNPKGFPYKRINEFAKCIAGATPSTKRKEYWSNGIIPWMSSGEVNYKRIWETEKRISQIGYDSCSTKMIPAHTVVIAMAGQGRTRGTVAVAEIPLCTNQSLCSIITDGTVDTDYLFTYLQFQYNNLRNISNGSSGRGGLNIKLIGQFAVLVPPLAIQQKFSNFLKEIDKSKLAVRPFSCNKKDCDCSQSFLLYP
ncbi:restriction endonuclease subunit S [uncultured Dialister sp.]|uniref:restriction endonuclease subunit S n=1 Tax=uncultured Dialister sp. TaxID=278064 RepID=UPI00259AA16D|nr:restriction endonuclease subunit S [uncultured Dialister sp.]